MTLILSIAARCTQRNFAFGVPQVVTNLFAQEGNKFQLAACKTTAESDQLRSTYSQGFAMDENDAKHRFESASTRDEANHEHENIELHWSGEW